MAKRKVKKTLVREYSNDSERTAALEDVLDAIFVESGKQELTWMEMSTKAKVSYMTVVNIGNRKSKSRINTVAKLARVVGLKFKLNKVQQKKSGRMGARVPKK